MRQPAIRIPGPHGGALATIDQSVARFPRGGTPPFILNKPFIQSGKMNTTPYWLDAADGSQRKALSQDMEVDVLIIGGGICGITTAYALSGGGLRIALVERQSLGARDTGHTTAHLTYMTDTRLSDLIATFGRDEARHSWEAGRAALDFIAAAVEENSIECDLQRVPGYLVAADGCNLSEEKCLLQKEAMVARQMGFDANFIDECPVTKKPGIRFGSQMEFHPLKYIAALALVAERNGVEIYEGSEVEEFVDSTKARVNGCEVSFRKVVIATHVPMQGNASSIGAAFFQTKLALYSTYAVRANLPPSGVGSLIWSDTGDPFLYIRTMRDEGGISCIIGGEDHRTGAETDTEQRYRNLEAKLQRLFPGAGCTHRWSGQVVETVDGLPFIGPTSESQFIATGFSGDGMTFGTIAAMMARDWVHGEEGAWSKLFDPSRRCASVALEYLKENKDFPIRMITDRLHVKEGEPASLRPGEAAVMDHDGKRVAASRRADGTLQVCSAVCPHLGCIVAWNAAERTWDCPCHGSRFQEDGRVIAGPAERDLGPLE